MLKDDEKPDVKPVPPADEQASLDEIAQQGALLLEDDDEELQRAITMSIMEEQNNQAGQSQEDGMLMKAN